MDATKRLTLAKERGILVDPQDEWLLKEYTWNLSNKGYPQTLITVVGGSHETRIRVRAFLHHCIMGYPIRRDDEIDHINIHPWDNRRANLRYVSRSINHQNTSREPGVSGARNIYIRDDGRYHVRIRRDYKEYYLGAFNTLEEAITRRDEWDM